MCGGSSPWYPSPSTVRDVYGRSKSMLCCMCDVMLTVLMLLVVCGCCVCVQARKLAWHLWMVVSLQVTAVRSVLMVTEGLLGWALSAWWQMATAGKDGHTRTYIHTHSHIHMHTHSACALSHTHTWARKCTPCCCGGRGALYPTIASVCAKGQ